MVIGGVEVIEENTSDSHRFFPVRNEKYSSHHFLKGGVENARGVFVAGDFESLVEVNGVFFVEIRRSQIASSSKPPSDGF